MVKDEPTDKGVGSVELEGDNVDLLAHLVILFAQIHLQLVNIVRYSFVPPRTNLE